MQTFKLSSQFGITSLNVFLILSLLIVESFGRGAGKGYSSVVIGFITQPVFAISITSLAKAYHVVFCSLL